MRTEPKRQVVWLALGCCVLMACSGCWPCSRHGLIFRGDFALELNRIPWMSSRGEQYQGAECGGGEYAESCEPVGCAAPACAGGLCSAGAEQPVAYHNEPRFHPVPTHPVFSPRGGMESLASAHGMIRQPDSMGTTPACPMPIESPPMRMLKPESGSPEPEQLPPTPPTPPSVESDATPNEQADAISSPPSWVFSPATNDAPSHQAAKGVWASRR